MEEPLLAALAGEVPAGEYEPHILMLRPYSRVGVPGVDDFDGVLKRFATVGGEVDAPVLLGNPEINNAAPRLFPPIADVPHDGGKFPGHFEILIVMQKRPDLAAFENGEVFFPPGMGIIKSIFVAKAHLPDPEAAVRLAVQDERADAVLALPVQGDEPALAVGAEAGAEELAGVGAILDPVDVEAVPPALFLNVGRPVPAAGAEQQIGHFFIGTEAAAADLQERRAVFINDLPLLVHPAVFDQEDLPAADDRADKSVVGHGEPALPAEAVEWAVRDAVDQHVQLAARFHSDHPTLPVASELHCIHPIPWPELLLTPSHIVLSAPFLNHLLRHFLRIFSHGYMINASPYQIER